MNDRIVIWVVVAMLACALLFVIVHAGNRSFGGVSHCTLPDWNADRYPGAKFFSGANWEYYLVVYEANTADNTPVGPIVFKNLVSKYPTTVHRCSGGDVLYDVTMHAQSPVIKAYGLCSLNRCYVFIVASCGELPPPVKRTVDSCIRTTR
ncbi:MAG: hypothetical protein GXN93_02065 [Candidatus Diapherotrites archaeon]|nr:hypothetical protein [Candidatus Diapherotrites archaeon]